MCHLWWNCVRTIDGKVSPTGFRVAQRLGKLKELGDEKTVGDVLGPWLESRGKGHPRGVSHGLWRKKPSGGGKEKVRRFLREAYSVLTQQLFQAPSQILTPACVGESGRSMK